MQDCNLPKIQKHHAMQYPLTMFSLPPDPFPYSKHQTPYPRHSKCKKELSYTIKGPCTPSVS
jgi:hypothetical protein